MTTQKTLSIIIPNYNKSKYISQTLDSILEQTLLPDEIIVVDDCSTDNSREILKAYEEKYPGLVFVCYLPENHGVQYARNYGAAQSTSEYITFIDSDDFYCNKNKLRNEMEYAEKNRIVCSDYLFFNQQKNEYKEVKYRTTDKLEFSLIPIGCMIEAKHILLWPYAYIVSKEAFDRIKGYDFEYCLYEDLDILIKLMLCGLKIKRIKSLGRAYRINDNTTNHLSEQQAERHKKALELIKQTYSQNITVTEKIISFCFKCVRKVLNIPKKIVLVFSSAK